MSASRIFSASLCSISRLSSFALSLSLAGFAALFRALPNALFAGEVAQLLLKGLPTPRYRPGLCLSLSVSESEKVPGFRMDFIEERRFGCVDSEKEGCGGSISAAEKDRFLEGERKELGEREEWRWVGEG